MTWHGIPEGDSCIRFGASRSLAYQVPFRWLISHQPIILFSQNKPVTSNQLVVLFSQNKPTQVISHQPSEQAGIPVVCSLALMATWLQIAVLFIQTAVRSISGDRDIGDMKSSCRFSAPQRFEHRWPLHCSTRRRLCYPSSGWSFCRKNLGFYANRESVHHVWIEQ
jgi:hypothetical protein